MHFNCFEWSVWKDISLIYSLIDFFKLYFVPDNLLGPRDSAMGKETNIISSWILYSRSEDIITRKIWISLDSGKYLEKIMQNIDKFNKQY
jgi:hypothetical protein